MIVTQKSSTNSLNLYTFEEFKEWISYRINADWKYNKTTEFYSILIIFEKNLVTLIDKKIMKDSLMFLKPIYPWKEEWLDYIKKSISEIIFLKQRIKALEKKSNNPDI